MMTTAPVLEISDLSIDFPVYGGAVRALDGVTLSVGHGRIVGLVGESGSGKSVTAMLSMGLLPDGGHRVVRGSVRLLGCNVLTAPERDLARLRGGKAAMIFQEPLTALNPTRRIGTQMVEVIRRHYQMSRASATKLAVRLLTEMRIGDPAETLKRYPFELSGGMRQRVLIALAFSSAPEIIIADEPTTALDVTVQRQVLTLLKERARQSDTAVLLITHDLGLVSQYADEVYVMYAGRVVESGTTAAVLSAPAHPYTRALLRALPETAVPKEPLAAIPGRVPDLRKPPTGCAFAERCSLTIPVCVNRPLLSPLVWVPSHTAACWRADQCETIS